MSIRTRNLVLTLACLALVAFALRTDGLSEGTRTALITAAFAFITGLWMHSGRGGGGGGLLVPLACAAQLAYGCQGGGVHWNGWRGAPAPQEAPGAQFAAGHIALIPQASSPIPSGTAGLYAKSSDSYPRLVDTAGVEYIAGTAWRVRQSAGTPGAVATGDLWYDTGTNTLLYRDNSGSVTLANGAGYLALAGTQTVTGDKTFTGALVLPAAASPAQTADASIVWDSDDNLLTVGDGAGRKTMCDLTTAQTLTNKTLTAPVLGGTVTGTYTLGGTPTIPASGLSGQVAIAAGGTGAATTSQNYVFAGPTSGSGAPSFRALVAGDLPAGGSFAAAFSGSTTDTSTFGLMVTSYLPSPGSTSALPNAQRTLHIVTRTGTISHLVASIKTAPGGSDTVILTAQKSSDMGATWSDTTLTCTITGAATSCTDTSHTPAVALYDWLAFKLVSSGNTAAGPIAVGAEVN